MAAWLLLAEVQWGSSHAGAGEVEHPWEHQVTLAEMVVDFALAPSVKIVPGSVATEADVTWAEKCQIFQEYNQKSGQELWIQPGFSVQSGAFSKQVRTLSLFCFEFLQGLFCRLDDHKKRVPGFRGLR